MKPSKVRGDGKVETIGAQFILKWAGAGFAVAGAFVWKELMILGLLLFLGSFLMPKKYKEVD